MLKLKPYTNKEIRVIDGIEDGNAVYDENGTRLYDKYYEYSFKAINYVWHLSVKKVVMKYGIVQEWNRNIYTQNEYALKKFFEGMDAELGINLSKAFFKKIFMKNNKAVHKKGRIIDCYEFN